MLNIALIDNGVEGATAYFGAGPGVVYRRERITAHWRPDFSNDDLIIAPNGTDHVALYEARAAVHAQLDRGGMLACFCGFFTPWIPGNVWRHDNRHPLKAVRYEAGADRHGLLDGVDIGQLSVEPHGISGWWACGEILTADPASVLLRDNFGRVVMVADDVSSRGLIVATASGPLGDADPTAPSCGTARLYRNIIRAAIARQEQCHD